MSPRTERLADNPPNYTIKIRATMEDRERLLYCCEKSAKIQYGIVMEGIETVYQELQK